MIIIDQTHQWGVQRFHIAVIFGEEPFSLWWTTKYDACHSCTIPK
jgi:hypothetical protein